MAPMQDMRRILVGFFLAMAMISAVVAVPSFADMVPAHKGMASPDCHCPDKNCADDAGACTPTHCYVACSGLSMALEIPATIPIAASGAELTYHLFRDYLAVDRPPPWHPPRL